MGLSIKKLETLLDKMFEIIKLKGVIKIEYELEPVGKNEYYLHLDYIVPDGSPHKNVKGMVYPKIDWNSAINKTLELYFGTKFIITSSGIKTESYYKQQKERENG